jgi:flagellar motor switch protein FliG
MSNRKSIIVTAYGHNNAIDKIAVCSLGSSENGHYDNGADATIYCNTINSLELKGDAWVFAKIISENTQYSLEYFFPLKFSDVIIKLDDKAIQKVLREMDSRSLVASLKDQNEIVQEKIFSNMTERASGMLKEDMEYMEPISIKYVTESQEKIINIILDLERCGEIIIPEYKGETTE